VGTTSKLEYDQVPGAAVHTISVLWNSKSDVLFGASIPLSKKELADSVFFNP
jgi:hypothetical protein